MKWRIYNTWHDSDTMQCSTHLPSIFKNVYTPNLLHNYTYTNIIHPKFYTTHDMTLFASNCSILYVKLRQPDANHICRTFCIISFHAYALHYFKAFAHGCHRLSWYSHTMHRNQAEAKGNAAATLPRINANL